ILADLSDDALPDISVNAPPQICEGARRRNDDERLQLALAYESLQCRSDLIHESVRFDIVPVSLFHARTDRPNTGKCPSRPVSPLLTGRRVDVSHDPLGLQVGKFLVTRVAQEKRLTAVTDENEAIVREVNVFHGMSRCPTVP